MEEVDSENGFSLTTIIVILSSSTDKDASCTKMQQHAEVAWDLIYGLFFGPQSRSVRSDNVNSLLFFRKFQRPTFVVMHVGNSNDSETRLTSIQ